MTMMIALFGALAVMGAAVVALAALLARERRRARRTADDDYTIGADERAVVIRVNEAGLPTRAQGKGMLPAQVAMCCFVVANNISEQLSADIARRAGYGGAQEPPVEANVPPGVLPVALPTAAELVQVQ